MTVAGGGSCGGGGVDSPCCVQVLRLLWSHPGLPCAPAEQLPLTCGPGPRSPPRCRAKADMAATKDPFRKAVFNGRQLALKVRRGAAAPPLLSPPTFPSSCVPAPAPYHSTSPHLLAPSINHGCRPETAAQPLSSHTPLLPPPLVPPACTCVCECECVWAFNPPPGASRPDPCACVCVHTLPRRCPPTLCTGSRAPPWGRCPAWRSPPP